MLLETKQFALVSHVYWFLWSLVQDKVSRIKFDYQACSIYKLYNTVRRIALKIIVNNYSKKP